MDRSHPRRGSRRASGDRGRSSTPQGGARRPNPRAGRGKRPSRTGGTRRAAPQFDPTLFINENPAPEVAAPAYEATHRFDTFGLDDRLTASLLERGYEVPSPIQDQVIPTILAGSDVVGLAETGTGKTAAFLLPLLHATLAEHRHQTLVLAPTRELAIQIERELRTLAGSLRFSSCVLVGGVNINPQIRALKKPQQFIIGTPGRVLDLIRRGNLKLSRVRAVVLDEADRMLDMGFIHDMRAILKETPAERRTLLFSATMPHEAQRLVNDFLRDPVTVSVRKRETTDSIEQSIVTYGPHDKFTTLTRLLADPAFTRVIIFGSMKHSVERLSKELSRDGIRAGSIHGNKNHNQRQSALDAFKSGKLQVLVATDVAARGIHVNDVSHVINYDLPNTREDYVHRIGRTGRGSKRGKAITFVPKHDLSQEAGGDTRPRPQRPARAHRSAGRPQGRGRSARPRRGGRGRVNS
ncbi:DEAD/DEAH box helicase [Patescibacteria group bacterium]|jgi:superfamily II DNA/RNA helicase|nr:DEAD/DEAH box helicase [Patescibacteria group bacterium]